MDPSLNLRTSGRCISRFPFVDQQECPELTRPSRPETFIKRPTAEQITTVRDISGTEQLYTLDSHGFQLYNHVSSEKTFDDEARIQAEYYPETEQLLKDA
jgi:hypothetical protein